MRKEEDFGTYM